MTVTNKRLVEILTTAMEKPEIANALIQRVINTLNKQPEQPDFSKAGFGKPQREEGCAECGKKSSDGWALYCVKCTERAWVGLTDDEILEEYRQSYGDDGDLTDVYFARAIEAKLKEKNSA
jgi:hypothetical protein